MQLSLLSLYVFSVFMLIITPGPVVALVINTSLNAGPKHALMTALGTNAASLVLVMIAALILAGTWSISEALLTVISLAGCLFIAWLAIQGLRDSLGSATPNTRRNGLMGGLTGGFTGGFLVAISNPKDIIFFVSFFPQFIQVMPTFEGSIALLACVWAVLDLSILLGYILLMRQQRITRYTRAITRVSSGVLLAIAGAGVVYSLGRLV